MLVTIDQGGEASANPGRLFAVTGPDAVLQLVNLILTVAMSAEMVALHVSDGGLSIHTLHADITWHRLVAIGQIATITGMVAVLSS